MPKLGGFNSDYSALKPLLRTISPKLYKRSVIEEARLRFDVSSSSGEDQAFNYSYYPHVKTYGYVDEPLYNYMHRDNGSLSQIRTKHAFESNLKMIREEIIFMEHARISEKAMIVCDQCASTLQSFFALSDERSPYSGFKERAGRIEEILQPYYVYPNLKRRLLFGALRHHFYFPVYCYYRMKRWYKRR